MEGATIDDPVFGRLVWDGFQHAGWGGSFTDAEFLSWGRVVTEALPDDEEEEEDEDDGPKTGAQDFLSELLTAAGGKLPQDEGSAKLLDMARAFAERADAYDGQLDADPLRKAGRLKVVVRNLKDTPPTAAQQAAWKTFRDRGDAVAEEIAAAVLATYRLQRPERLRWWERVYRDSPDATLPDVRTTRQMREIVRPSEFRVYHDRGDGVIVAVVLESFWSDKELKVSVRDGNVIGVGLVESTEGIDTAPAPVEIDGGVFGRLRRGQYDDGWLGVFHSDVLRGWCEASAIRYRSKKNRAAYATPWRPGPSWDVVTGDFGLQIAAPKGQRPTPEQAAAFGQFNADPDATARLVLSAIFDWYKGIRPDWAGQWQGSKAELAAKLPVVKRPEELLEFIQLQSVHVLEAPAAEETAGPRTSEIRFGPNAGKKFTVPPRKPGVAIALAFAWEDEHGLGVRWRNGVVEKVGDHESAYED